MEFIGRIIKENAKAIAVPVTAVLLAIITWITGALDVEFFIDNEALTNTVAAIIIAIVVWWTRNQARKEPVPEMLRDRGQSGLQILYIIAAFLIILCLIVWLLGQR